MKWNSWEKNHLNAWRYFGNLRLLPINEVCPIFSLMDDDTSISLDSLSKHYYANEFGLLFLKANEQARTICSE